MCLVVSVVGVLRLRINFTIRGVLIMHSYLVFLDIELVKVRLDILR